MKSLAFAAILLAYSPAWAQTGSSRETFDKLIQQLEELDKGSGRYRGMINRLKETRPAKPEEMMPITPTDQIALKQFYNMNPTFAAKKAVLEDLAAVAAGHPVLKVAMEYPGFEFTDDNYQISLGGGYGSLGLYELLKNYHARYPEGKVIYRTVGAPSRWTDSTFPGPYSHKIESRDVELTIEYYGIPGSHIYAYRIGGRSIPEQVGNYGIITPLRVYRIAYSIVDPRKKGLVENRWFIHGFEKDLAAVLKQSPEEIAGSRFELEYGKGNPQLVITAKALY